MPLFGGRLPLLDSKSVTIATLEKAFGLLKSAGWRLVSSTYNALGLPDRGHLILPCQHL